MKKNKTKIKSASHRKIGRPKLARASVAHKTTRNPFPIQEAIDSIRTISFKEGRRLARHEIVSRISSLLNEKGANCRPTIPSIMKSLRKIPPYLAPVKRANKKVAPMRRGKGRQLTVVERLLRGEKPVVAPVVQAPVAPAPEAVAPVAVVIPPAPVEIPVPVEAPIAQEPVAALAVDREQPVVQ
jgi:hypothetical protein